MWVKERVDIQTQHEHERVIGKQTKNTEINLVHLTYKACMLVEFVEWVAEFIGVKVFWAHG